MGASVPAVSTYQDTHKQIAPKQNLIQVLRFKADTHADRGKARRSEAELRVAAEAYEQALELLERQRAAIKVCGPCLGDMCVSGCVCVGDVCEWLLIMALPPPAHGPLPFLSRPTSKPPR